MRNLMLRWLIRWMERHYNSVLLPDGTYLWRMSAEFREWAYFDGWALFCDRTGKNKGGHL